MPRSNYPTEAAYRASRGEKNESFHNSRRSDIEDAFDKPSNKKRFKKGKKYGGSNAGGASIGG